MPEFSTAHSVFKLLRHLLGEDGRLKGADERGSLRDNAVLLVEQNESKSLVGQVALFREGMADLLQYRG